MGAPLASSTLSSGACEFAVAAVAVSGYCVHSGCIAAVADVRTLSGVWRGGCD